MFLCSIFGPMGSADALLCAACLEGALVEIVLVPSAHKTFVPLAANFQPGAAHADVLQTPFAVPQTALAS